MRALLLLTISASAFACERVGSLTQKATTGNQAYTFGGGTACVPKVVLFFSNNATADGGTADARIGLGAGASATLMMSGYAVAIDAQATTNTARRSTLTSALTMINGAQTTVAAADIVTMDADGFTLNWTTTDGTARVINYLAIGGSDVSNVYVGMFTGSGSPQSITTPGFRPDLLILYATGTDGATDNFTQTIGMATASDSWSVSTSSQDNVADSVAKRLQRTGVSLAALASAGTLASECTTAFTATGFDQTCATQGGLRTLYVAIKGGSWKLGSFNAPTSNGTSAVTGVGFTPSTVLLGSFSTTTSSSIQANARSSWGAGTSSSARFSLWAGETDNAATSVASKYVDRTKIFTSKTEAGASPTGLAEADLVSFASDTFTLDWTDAPPAAWEIVFLAIRTAEAGGATPVVRRAPIYQ